MKGEYSVRGLCALLGVSASGYYRWRHAGPGPARQEASSALAAHDQQPPRSAGGAQSAGAVRTDWPEPSVGDRHHLCGDGRRLAVCCGILDGWSRRLVGWSCSATLHTPLVLAALESAIARRQPGPGLIHHSDRGCQYVDTTYRAMLQDHCFIQSMSGAGNCYDNAAMESFWSTLKTEADLRTKIPADRRQAELAVFDYIETFYNQARRHSSLGYLSPVAFENQHTLKDIIAV
jgi:transposase InsO family protein